MSGIFTGRKLYSRKNNKLLHFRKIIFTFNKLEGNFTLCKKSRFGKNNIFYHHLANLMVLNPKTAGGSIWPPPCGFSKNVSSEKRVKRWFFVAFNIILKYIFPENFIEFPQKIWRHSLSILAIFINFSRFFWIFWHYLVTLKLMMSAYNRWCQHFFTFSIL